MLGVTILYGALTILFNLVVDVALRLDRPQDPVLRRRPMTARDSPRDAANSPSA